MNDQATHTTLLDEIYALGEALRLALETDDIEAFADLVGRRGVLIDQLQTAPRKDEDLQRHAERFNQQYADILAATAALEKHLIAAQGTLKQVQQARGRYSGRRESPRYLNKDLCG